ncbi:MAG: hypothetical protein ACOYBL_09005 [Lachnospiraceae bacterium]|jgi:hypothetical protein
MSQAKVDKYKEEKANRQQIMKKEKRNRFMWKLGGGAVALAAVVWIGYSVYGVAKGDVQTSLTTETTEINVDAMNDYLDTIAPKDE